MVSMAENENVTGRPADDDNGGETASQAPVPPQAPAPVMKARWRDRAWTFRAMVGVALASLLLGGLAGGAVMAASDDGDDRLQHHRMGPWGPDGDAPPGWRHRGPREFQGDGGPGWRWEDGPEDGPSLRPPTASPSPEEPGSTG
jgi:hypothetical protein